MAEEENMVGHSGNPLEEISESWGGGSSSDRSMVGTFWWLIQWRLELPQKRLVDAEVLETLTTYPSTHKEIVEPYSKELYIRPRIGKI